jgi:glycosyltransferase involved in cell wall biosynthesis
VTIRQETKLGMAENWNECLQRATGKFFLLLSDDDLLEPQAIQGLVDCILKARDPERIAFAYCRSWVIDSKGAPILLDPIAPEYESSKDFVLGFFRNEREVRPCSSLLRTDDIRNVGGYDQKSAELAVDAIVWSKVLKMRGGVGSFQAPASKYRFHKGNLSSLRSISVWQGDLRQLASIWLSEFQSESADYRRALFRATERHEAWMIAVIINQSATTLVDRIRVLRTYVRCRSSFRGPIGLANLGLGLAKLLTPEWFKKPIRQFLIRIQLKEAI